MNRILDYMIIDVPYPLPDAKPALAPLKRAEFSIKEQSLISRFLKGIKYDRVEKPGYSSSFGTASVSGGVSPEYNKWLDYYPTFGFVYYDFLSEPGIIKYDLKEGSERAKRSLQELKLHFPEPAETVIVSEFIRNEYERLADTDGVKLPEEIEKGGGKSGGKDIPLSEPKPLPPEFSSDPFFAYFRGGYFFKAVKRINGVFMPEMSVKIVLDGRGEVLGLSYFWNDTLEQIDHPKEVMSGKEAVHNLKGDLKQIFKETLKRDPYALTLFNFELQYVIARDDRTKVIPVYLLDLRYNRPYQVSELDPISKQATLKVTYNEERIIVGLNAYTGEILNKTYLIKTLDQGQLAGQGELSF